MRRRARAIGAWIGEHVVKTAVTTLVGAAVLAGVGLLFRGGDDGRRDAQTIAEVRADLAGRGYEIASFRRLTLHPPTTSYVFALRREGELGVDELRVYDGRDADVAQKLAFRPAIDHPGRGSGVGLNFAFEQLAARDFDGDGNTELVGSYTHESIHPAVRLPVTLAWDERGQRYRLEPLLRDGVAPADPPPAPEVAPSGARTYTEPYAVRDAATGRAFRSYAAQGLAVVPSGRGTALVGTYPLPGPLTDTARYQLSAWSFRFVAGRPDVASICFQGVPKPGGDIQLPLAADAGTPRFVTVRAPRGISPSRVAARTWRRIVAGDRAARSGAIRSGIVVGVRPPGGNCLFGE